MIPVNLPLLDGREADYLAECIRSGWISSEGPFVSRFEAAMAARVERKFGVACSSGSAALDLAVAAAEIGAGDEVIMPALTIISPAASVVRAGGVPVLVDSDPVTWNMDPSQIEAKISARTKAIMAVHLYGLPVDLQPLLEVADRHGLLVIEDAAEMHGQTYRGRPCGSFGQLSTLSFYANKHVACGEGGMVLTDDERLADKCRSFRNLCFQPERRFVHEELGWNYRMTNLQAAVGLAQLESLDRHVTRKRQIGRQYQDAFQELACIQLPLPEADYAENIYWVFGIVLNERCTLSAGELMRRLGAQGVGTRPFFWPMHRQPVWQRRGLFVGESYPHASMLAEQGLYLPSGLGTSDDQIRYVVESLTRLLSEARL